ncbi:alpha-tocopherol transfer protein isoform X1 [Plutella xylostella]|uniref:alpha-tocopherol transfer protein isoform X1 n=1 Tax=Plutella xylostella TaxID=51655 RepID=UPI002032E4CC|nr:alpha-tocopherol transfer protein isoform X1 [Plutella xylostella]
MEGSNPKAMPSPDYSVELDLGEPPPELLQYAREHCGELPDTRLQAVEDLRTIIYERGECSPHRTDDEFLVKFLRARNFIPARAHRLLVNYYRFKEENSKLFKNVFPFDLREIGDRQIMSVPPYRDQDGRRLLLYRIGCWSPKKIPIDDLFRGTIMALELGLLEPRSQILGGVALFDLEGIGTKHAWEITPGVASRIIKLLVSSFPANTHAIHIINHSWVFDKMYSIFKPLLNSQMKSRIFFHGHDCQSLHKHILPAHLPERYGGIHPDYSYTIWLDSLKKNYRVVSELIDCGYKFREDEVAPEVVRRLKEEGFKLS